MVDDHSSNSSAGGSESLESATVAYFVEEPFDGASSTTSENELDDAVLQRLDGVEEYLKGLHSDRDQLRGQLTRLYAGCEALCRSIARPEADIENLKETQQQLTGGLAQVEQVRGQVTSTVTSLTLKADEVMRRVPDLQNQLDACVQTITGLASVLGDLRGSRRSSKSASISSNSPPRSPGDDKIHSRDVDVLQAIADQLATKVEQQASAMERTDMLLVNVSGRLDALTKEHEELRLGYDAQSAFLDQHVTVLGALKSVIQAHLPAQSKDGKENHEGAATTVTIDVTTIMNVLNAASTPPVSRSKVTPIIPALKLRKITEAGTTISPRTSGDVRTARLNEQKRLSISTARRSTEKAPYVRSVGELVMEAASASVVDEKPSSRPSASTWAPISNVTTKGGTRHSTGGSRPGMSRKSAPSATPLPTVRRTSTKAAPDPVSRSTSRVGRSHRIPASDLGTSPVQQRNMKATGKRADTVSPTHSVSSVASSRSSMFGRSSSGTATYARPTAASVSANKPVSTVRRTVEGSTRAQPTPRTGRVSQPAFSSGSSYRGNRDKTPVVASRARDSSNPSPNLRRSVSVNSTTGLARPPILGRGPSGLSSAGSLGKVSADGLRQDGGSATASVLTSDTEGTPLDTPPSLSPTKDRDAPDTPQKTSPQNVSTKSPVQPRHAGLGPVSRGSMARAGVTSPNANSGQGSPTRASGSFMRPTSSSRNRASMDSPTHPTFAPHTNNSPSPTTTWSGNASAQVAKSPPRAAHVSPSRSSFSTSGPSTSQLRLYSPKNNSRHAVSAGARLSFSNSMTTRNSTGGSRPTMTSRLPNSPAVFDGMDRTLSSRDDGSTRTGPGQWIPTGIPINGPLSPGRRGSLSSGSWHPADEKPAPALAADSVPPTANVVTTPTKSSLTPEQTAAVDSPSSDDIGWKCSSLFDHAPASPVDSHPPTSSRTSPVPRAEEQSRVSTDSGTFELPGPPVVSADSYPITDDSSSDIFPDEFDDKLGSESRMGSQMMTIDEYFPLALDSQADRFDDTADSVNIEGHEQGQQDAGPIGENVSIEQAQVDHMDLNFRESDVYTADQAISPPEKTIVMPSASAWLQGMNSSREPASSMVPRHASYTALDKKVPGPARKELSPALSLMSQNFEEQARASHSRRMLLKTGNPFFKRHTNLTDRDTFSIDSKDSCKPEKCESPRHPEFRSVVSRNGQGTSVDVREAELLASQAAETSRDQAVHRRGNGVKRALFPFM